MSQVSSEDHDLALAVLEHDQLATAKSKRYPRRSIKGVEALVVWSLRIYVLFMLAVVLYQVANSAR